MLSARSDARVEQSPRPTKGAASTEIKALKEAHATEVRALQKEHQTALKQTIFEERRKNHDNQHEVVGPLKEALEQAKNTAAEAQVEVSDLNPWYTFEHNDCCSENIPNGNSFGPDQFLRKHQRNNS